MARCGEPSSLPGASCPRGGGARWRGPATSGHVSKHPGAASCRPTCFAPRTLWVPWPVLLLFCPLRDESPSPCPGAALCGPRIWGAPLGKCEVKDLHQPGSSGQRDRAPRSEGSGTAPHFLRGRWTPVLKGLWGARETYIGTSGLAVRTYVHLHTRARNAGYRCSHAATRGHPDAWLRREMSCAVIKGASGPVAATGGCFVLRVGSPGLGFLVARVVLRCQHRPPPPSAPHFLCI